MASIPDEAFRALSELVTRADKPQWLYGAWRAGRVADEHLRFLIPHAWTRHDWPEAAIGAAAWVEMFRIAGYVCEPDGLLLPTGAITVYRGAPRQRSRGMAWSTDVKMAGDHRDRRRKLGEAAFVYVTTIDGGTAAATSTVLARFDSRGEAEVVVDPQHLGSVDRFD